MAHYTTTIKTLIDNGFDFGLQSYPIYNETHRQALNEKILNHYYMNEIGFETANLFKFYLNNKMNEIMPYYNDLYRKQEILLENAIDNVNLYEDSNRLNSNSLNTSSNTTNRTKNMYQDTPQGKINLSSLESETWATNFTDNLSNGNDTSTSSGNNTEDYTRHIHGNNGKKYNIELFKDIKENILNIDLMIINELEDLFMGIY